MELKIKKRPSWFWYYFWQILYLIPIAVTLQYFQLIYMNSHHYRYIDTNLDIVEPKSRCQQLAYELTHLRKEIINIWGEFEEMRAWKTDLDLNFDQKIRTAFDVFYSDQIGILDHASEYSGGYIISTPQTISYPSKFGLRIFGMFDLTRDSQPNVILQSQSSTGNCYAFYGNKGRILVGLGHPVVVTHVSLEHLRLGEELRSAPKDFQVLGVAESGLENLGEFFYDLNDSIIQTFRVSSKNQTFRSVELRILSNYGHEFTCVYRFRVHSLNLNLK